MAMKTINNSKSPEAPSLPGIFFCVLFVWKVFHRLQQVFEGQRKVFRLFWKVFYACRKVNPYIGSQSSKRPVLAGNNEKSSRLDHQMQTPFQQAQRLFDKLFERIS